MTENRSEKQIYMTGLDGLRALAVLAVIGYHLGLPFLPGGFLGVTLFFVLSGYLITDILLAEWDRDSRIGLKTFFIRRAKRLLPGMLFLLICLSVYVIVFRPELLTNLKTAFLPALLFYSNWWYIYSGTPYFSSLAMPSVLNHFWSLAVEAQFYLIWPFAVIVLQRFVRRRWLKIALTAALAVASAALMAALYIPGTDPSRIYYGTDTRIFSLLLGACMAFALPSRRLIKPLQKKTSRLIFEIAGFVVLLAVLFAMYYFVQYEEFLYLGGMFLFSAAAALLIAVSASPSTVLGRFLSVKPLIFIGKISYGAYLWQFPVIVISNAIIRTNNVNALLSLGQLAASFLMAAFSYYVVENPVRRSGAGAAVRNGFVMKYLHKRMWKKAAALLVIMLLLVSGVGLLAAEPKADDVEEVLSALPSALHIAPSETPAASVTPEPSRPPAEAVPADAVPAPAASPSIPADLSPGAALAGSPPPAQSPDTEPDVLPVTEEEIVPSDLSVTFIGDSIGIDVLPYIKAYYPNLIADAEVGRQLYAAKGIIQKLLENGELAQTVIIELGSNGIVKESTLREIIALIGSDRRIVFVNTQVPRTWCQGVNEMLARVSAEYDNTCIADWYGASIEEEDYFYNDGIHPNKTGSLVMARIISDAVEAIQEN